MKLDTVLEPSCVMLGCNPGLPEDVGPFEDPDVTLCPGSNEEFGVVEAANVRVVSCWLTVKDKSDGETLVELAAWLAAEAVAREERDIKRSDSIVLEADILLLCIDLYDRS